MQDRHKGICEATGLETQYERMKSFTSSGKSGIITTENLRRKTTPDGREIIDKATYNKLTKSFLNSGGIIIRGDEADRRLGTQAHASYIVGAGAAYIRDDASVSDVLEEMYHALQDRRKDYGEYPDEVGILKREIDAQNYLISVADKYKIPESETSETRKNLTYYEEKLKDLEGE